MLIARDFVTIKLPAGGYTDAHNNTGFDLDLSCMTNRIRPATQESLSLSQHSNNDNNQNFNRQTYNINVNSFIKQSSSNHSSERKTNSPTLNNDDINDNTSNYSYSYVHTSGKKHTNNDSDCDDYNDIYSISSVLKSNSANEEKWEDESFNDYTKPQTVSLPKREEEHVYNKANMDKWNFNYNVPLVSAINHNGNGYRSNNLDNPRNKIKKRNK